MKNLFITVLTALTALTMASTQVYAAVTYQNIDGAKLIDHFEEKGVNLPSTLQNPKYVSIYTEAHESHGMTNTNVLATGSFSFTLENDFSSMRSYIVEVYMCVQNKDCYHTKDTFAVEPFKKGGISGNASTYSYIAKAGKYEDELTVTISGSESKTGKSVNTVTVG